MPAASPPIEDRKQALVIDDDETVLDFLMSALGKLDYDVFRARDGFAALNLCRELRFDLVVCDVDMPRMNGITFLTQVSRECADQERRIVMMSAFDDLNLRRDALEAGATAYLVKPLTIAMLRAALATK